MADIRTSLIVPPSAWPTSLTSETRIGSDQATRLATPSRPLKIVFGSEGRPTSRAKAPVEATPVTTGPMVLNASADCSSRRMPSGMICRASSRAASTPCGDWRKRSMKGFSGSSGTSGPPAGPNARSVRESNTSSRAMPSPIEWWSRPMSTLPPSL